MGKLAKDLLVVAEQVDLALEAKGEVVTGTVIDRVPLPLLFGG